ncbi:MAG TPA: alpha-amylase family protein [Candidatus Limnocylindrales bacterium]
MTPIAEEFDATAFAETMRVAHVESVNVFARCHHGFSYYPTKVGTTHPGLGFDLLGRQIEALHAVGIKAIAYVTIGWDDLAAARDPGWVVVDRDGRLDARAPLTAPSIAGGLSPDDDPMAPRWSLLDPSTGYGDYVCDQVRELCESYEIDGFWFDICLAVPNYSPWGLAEMAAAGIDAADEAVVVAFARRRELAYLERVSRLVGKLTPGAEVFFNGTMDAAMGETVGLQTHLDLESLATSPGLWGYLHYPMAARQARVYGLPFTGMTGRFHKSWADFGGLKTFDQLDYEAATIMAAGGGVFIGDQLHPSGVLDPAVYRLIGRVFERVERLEPWLRGVVSPAEVAIISDPRLVSFGGQPATAQNPEVEGAAQMFLESGIQFDIVDPGAELTRYRLIVLPDGLTIGRELRANLETHIARGDALLVSGTASLEPGGEFALDVVPVEYVAPVPTMPCYFRVDDVLAAASADLAIDYDYVLYDRASVVRPREGSEPHGTLSGSLFDRTWEHFFSHAQSPVGERLGVAGSGEAGAPLLVFGGNGKVAYLAAPLFRAYRDHDYWPYRDLVLAAVRRLLPDPLLRFDGPPWIEASVLVQPQLDGVDAHPARRIVHLVAYHPRRTVQSVPHVDRSWPTAGVRVAVRTGTAPARCYLAPSGADLPFTFADGYTSIELPEVGTHTVMVIE